MIGPPTTRNGIVPINLSTTRAGVCRSLRQTGRSNPISQFSMRPSCGCVRKITENDQKSHHPDIPHAFSPIDRPVFSAATTTSPSETGMLTAPHKGLSSTKPHHLCVIMSGINASFSVLVEDVDTATAAQRAVPSYISILLGPQNRCCTHARVSAVSAR